MQTSKKMTKSRIHWLTLYFTLLIIGSSAIWFSQSSINAYWQQTYHQESPLRALNQYSWWKLGSQFQRTANTNLQEMNNWLTHTEEKWTHLWQPNTQVNHQNDVDDNYSTAKHNIVAPKANEQATSVADSSLDSVTETVALNEPTTATAQANDELDNFIHQLQQEPSSAPSSALAILNRGDKVFFAGDSLMQGVAPHIQKILKKQYHIDSINLSKQSTGLSYPNFFDWPATIEKTIKGNRNIKLLVVFLGPNDPWDFPNPKKSGGSYLKFKSPEWESVYRQRIQRIVQAAKSADAQIIWLGIPYMKSKKLNTQMRYLDQLIADELNNKVIWLPTDKLLSGNVEHYTDTLLINGKNWRLRTKDGIHFSLKGQQFLADYVLQHIQFQ